MNKKSRIQATLDLMMCADSCTDTEKSTHTQKVNINHVSCVMYHSSGVTCHLLPSPVTCHLTTTLCSFSCYESPRMLGDAAEGGLVESLSSQL